MRVISQLERIDGIKYAGANKYLEVELNPSDPLYTNPIVERGQWGLDRIQAPLVWNQTTGSRNVRVGIIDSGIANHPDLNANLDNGWDFLNATPTRGNTDIDSHGTHVAGIAGAVGNNIGIAGVNWNVTLVQMRVGTTSVNEAAVTRAVSWARDNWNNANRVSVLNCSFGGYIPSPNLETAIRDYSNLGGLFICSTGNYGLDNDVAGQHHYPSFYASNMHTNPIANMIAVGRSDINDARPTYANCGARTITLFAPGHNILSTVPVAMCNASGSGCTAKGTHIEHGYHLMSGSSMATPMVTGVAALIWSMYPNMTAAQIKQLIINNVDPVPDLKDLCYTGGRLNAVRALAAGHPFKGSGRQSDPYLIETEIQLRFLPSNSTAFYKLANDIDLSSYSNWSPIPSFNGNFDGNSGNGYTISNLKMTYTSNNSLGYGLFSTNNGTIQNLKVTANINFQNYNGSYVDTAKPVGVITVRNNGVISNCQVSASGSDPMIYCKTYYTERVGGITAYNSGYISTCKNNGIIYSGGDTGGIVGYNMGTINNCENNALICYTLSDNRISKIHSIGGIAGINYYSISNVTNKAMILYGGYSQVNDKLLQPRMAHIVGTNDNSVSSASWTSGASVNKGNLITFSWTENGTTYTHNQALYVRNAAVGVQY